MLTFVTNIRYLRGHHVLTDYYFTVWRDGRYISFCRQVVAQRDVENDAWLMCKHPNEIWLPTRDFLTSKFFRVLYMLNLLGKYFHGFLHVQHKLMDALDEI